MNSETAIMDRDASNTTAQPSRSPVVDMPMTRLARSWRTKLLYWGSRLFSLLTGGRGSMDVYLICVQPLRTLGQVRSSGSTRVCEVHAGADCARAFPRPEEVNRQRFEAGHRCFVATVKEQFAGHIWIARGHYDEDAFRCRYTLPADGRSVWDFDVYVEPRYRLGRTGALLWSEVAGQLRAQGVEQCYSRISLFNTPSIQVHERMGARRVACCAFVALGPVQLMLSSVGPRIRLSLGRKSARPELKLPHAAAADAPPTPGSAAALILGADSHGLAMFRALARAGVHCYVAEHDPTQPGLKSRYLKGHFSVPHFNAPEYPAALAALRQKLSAYQDVVLLAVNDRHVEQIGKHAELLRPLYRVAWLPQAQTVLNLQRKDALEARSRAQGLNYPQSVVIERMTQANEAREFQPPLILKPVRPLSAFKTEIAQSHEELLQLLQRHEASLPILVQEYIAGGDDSIFFGALTLSEGRLVRGMVGRKLASHPPARGQTTIAQTYDEPEVLRLSQRFFEGLPLSGVVSLELKRDPQGRYWVIEPTVGRFDFWVELCIQAGYNQPLHEYQLALGLRPEAGPQTLRPSVWYDTERDPLAFVHHCQALHKYLGLPGHRSSFPYLRQHFDWLPFLASSIRLAGKQAVRAARALRFR
ncbi:MAG: GNAT family N-acetyltransferase [Roseateles asaccharophilus]